MFHSYKYFFFQNYWNQLFILKNLIFFQIVMTSMSKYSKSSRPNLLLLRWMFIEHTSSRFAIWKLLYIDWRFMARNWNAQLQRLT